MHRRTRRPSAALAVACLALFVALSGTSFADIAQIPPRNSVGTPQLKANAVTSPKVRNGSLRVIDLAPAARRALRGQRGPAGPAGTQGPKGDKGDKGDPGSAGATDIVVVPASSGIDSSTSKSAQAACPADRRLIAGGAQASALAGIALQASRPDGNTWRAVAREINANANNWILQVWAVCAKVD